MISNKNVVNCRVVVLIEYYNYDIDFLSMDIVNHAKYDPRMYIEYLDL